ncbi:MAG: hypothetical protein GF350_11250 [Chitinivibrionales bacterium]|nr:hypothetical protein [Chitinivibrionales bacterium]
MTIPFLYEDFKFFNNIQKEGIVIKIIGGLPHGGDSTKIIHGITEDIKKFVKTWRDRQANDPGLHRKMEWEALRLCARFAGLIIALVLLDRRIRNAAEREGLKSRPDRVRSPRQVMRNVKLPGGILLRVKTPYCAPKSGTKAKKSRKQEGQGIYPAFAALGIFEGKSPLMADLILRFSLQMPSFEIACKELTMLGHPLDSKMPERTVRDFGKQALEARNKKISDWHAGKLEPETILTGRKVVVSVDGGRLRTRKKKRKTRKGKNRKYKTPWREPKLLIIYALDEHGKREKKIKAQIDATMAGPDEAMELMAYHLFRLGAGEAEVVEFIADGAPWIWERIDAVIAMAGLDPKRCRKVLDIYHAFEHIGEALDACGLKGKEKKRQMTRLKRKLKAGKVEDVVRALQGYLDKSRTDREALGKQIAYITKRRHMMKYDTLKRRRLAIGSGAVESAIRRVINLRIKSPSMFWNEDTAEAMIHMRSQLLSDRWDEMMEQIKEHSKVSRRRNFKLIPTLHQKNRDNAA